MTNRRGPRQVMNLRWGLALLLCCLAAASLAHRGHAVWTDISWAEDRFEIVHRLYLPDAITINRHMGGTQPVEDLHSLARIALYVEERFSLLDGGGTALSLDTLGAEISDNFLYVYQEWVTPLPDRFPAIDNRLLLDVEPGSRAFMRIKGPNLNEDRTR
jgi:hypothetical protein